MTARSNVPRAGNAARPKPQAVREAFHAGLISLGLFALMVGVQSTQNIDNRLVIVQRWWLLAIVVGLVAATRFVLVAWLFPYADHLKARRARATRRVRLPAMVSANLTALAIGGLLVFPLVAVGVAGLQGSLKWIDNFGIQVLIYVMLAWGLNIVVGLAGLLDLGYVAFYAVGAYSYALLGTEFGWSFWILLPVSGVLAAFWGIILGFPVLRLRGDYLAVVTLAFGEIIRIVLINWREVTNGAVGISGVPKVSFFGIFTFNVSDPNYVARFFDIPQSSVYYKIFLYYLILALCLLTGFVTTRLRRMPVGRAWEALREDEVACRSLGINTTNTKLSAFATGAMFAGFAGCFFAARQGFVSPESFIFIESAIILAIVVLGGMGSLTGIAIAAVAMIGGTEILREMEFLKLVFGPEFTPELYRMLLFGLAMVVVMLWKPRGFVGSREPTAFLNESKAVSGSLVKEGHG